MKNVSLLVISFLLCQHSLAGSDDHLIVKNLFTSGKALKIKYIGDESITVSPRAQRSIDFKSISAANTENSCQIFIGNFLKDKNFQLPQNTEFLLGRMDSLPELAAFGPSAKIKDDNGNILIGLTIAQQMNGYLAVNNNYVRFQMNVGELRDTCKDRFQISVVENEYETMVLESLKKL